ncbi:hypothetical protein HK097_001071 [Rhizophlyctis rosea]|uniref:Cytochrome P450 n=1 Tax=Rhizophlyctis rosea TaxID=64517 RepID=A0AAD5S4T9_9FUNG|nr:hypothetical protein HK097_001071 [Rhizophlyctis rosea]
MTGVVSKLWEDVPVLNSLDPLVELGIARLQNWSSKDTLAILAVAVGGASTFSYYVYTHLDPTLRQMISGEVDRGQVGREIQKRGPIHKVYGLNGPGYLIWGEAAGKWMLNTEKNNLFSGREGRSKFSRLLFQGSILDKDFAAHSKTRRLLSQAFKSDSLRAYLPRMVQEVRHDFDLWVQLSNQKGYVDLELELKQLALRFAFTLLVGADFTKDHEMSTGLVQKYEELLLGFIPWPIGEWNGKEKSMKVRRMLVEDVKGIIRKRRELLAKGVMPDFSDPLWLLMNTKDENGQGLTDDELADECVVLVIAGHETTARTLASFTVEILQNPTLLLDLRKEQSDLVQQFPLENGNYTNDHIKHMPLLDACFREIERMYGPAVEVSRVVRNDIVFKDPESGKEMKIRKGKRIAWSITATNRDPRVYPDPDTFDPYRWIEGAAASPSASAASAKGQDSDLGAVKVSSFRLATFGAGHRVCLGMQFARMEMLIIAGMMIKDYDFSDVKPGVELIEVRRPKFGYRDGVPVKFTKRV